MLTVIAPRVHTPMLASRWLPRNLLRGDSFHVVVSPLIPRDLPRGSSFRILRTLHESAAENDLYRT